MTPEQPAQQPPKRPPTDPLRVVCPDCGAAVSRPCVGLRGNAVHSERWTFAASQPP